MASTHTVETRKYDDRSSLVTTATSTTRPCPSHLINKKSVLNLRVMSCFLPVSLLCRFENPFQDVKIHCGFFISAEIFIFV